MQIKRINVVFTDFSIALVRLNTSAYRCTDMLILSMLKLIFKSSFNTCQYTCHRVVNSPLLVSVAVFEFDEHIVLFIPNRLFIDALWSPAEKGLTSWLSFVMSNCEVVTFPLVSWDNCGA